MLVAAMPAWWSVSADEAAPIVTAQSEQIDAQMAAKGKASTRDTARIATGLTWRPAPSPTICGSSLMKIKHGSCIR